MGIKDIITTSGSVGFFGHVMDAKLSLDSLCSWLYRQLGWTAQDCSWRDGQTLLPQPSASLDKWEVISYSELNLVWHFGFSFPQMKATDGSGEVVSPQPWIGWGGGGVNLPV